MEFGSVWSECSASCDTGLKTRQRKCNNPVPSSGGLYCEGSVENIVLCNQQQCQRKNYFKCICYLSKSEIDSIELNRIYYTCYKYTLNKKNDLQPYPSVILPRILCK